MEKQQIVKLQNVSEETIAESTKNILSKIEEINKKEKFAVPTTKVPKSRRNEERKYGDFKFSNSPFNNPILEYINQNPIKAEHKTAEEDDVPAQYIKRKVTHQQTYVAPSLHSQLLYPLLYPQYFYGQNLKNTKISDMEKQTIDNVKNIVIQSHIYPEQSIPIFNPYSTILPMNFQPNSPQGRQGITWPWAQYFPIIIKDPLLQMINAFTTMVEYGPDANCKPGKSDERTAKSLEENGKLNYNIKNPNSKPEITIFGVQNSSIPSEPNSNVTVLDIEDLKITDNSQDPVKFSLNFKSPIFEVSNTKRQAKVTKGETKRVTIKHGEIKESPPVRDQELGPDELEAEAEGEAEEITVDTTISKDDGPIAHNNNKKFFSKDNTGSGIFIHKIKVRKGGVAIAGPGGIATAGSGGTAIVGPNGFAYTHPDSVAIAGSGSKVIAIDPSISLSDVVQNKTRKDGSTPRTGKVVAVGPVIYYNKGK